MKLRPSLRISDRQISNGVVSALRSFCLFALTYWKKSRVFSNVCGGFKIVVRSLALFISIS
jgi:hypothetical protein